MLDIHRHCYTGDWIRCREGQQSSDKVWLCRITAICSFGHPRLDEIVKMLESHQLLLKTVSHYLVLPEHIRC